MTVKERAKLFSECLLLIVSSVFKNEEKTLYLDSPISQFGLDSVSVAKIASLVNKIFEISISPVNLYGHKTVREAANTLYHRFGEELDFQGIDLTSISELIHNVTIDNGVATKHSESHGINDKTVSVGAVRSRLILLSSSSRESLLDDVIELIQRLNKDTENSRFIDELERKPMSFCHTGNKRLAVIANDSEGLLKALNKVVAKEPSDQILLGTVADGAEKITLFSTTKNGKIFIRNTLLNGNVRKIAALWVIGINVDLNAFLQIEKDAALRRRGNV